MSSEAAKTRSLAPDGDIREIDFFDLDPTEVAPVDVAIGNPPYIRYHRFAGSDREKALGRARLQGVELNQLASSWAHFTVHAAGFLKPTGRLALVLPAELLHADYGLPVRDFLLRRFASLVVIAFDRMVFPEALVDAGAPPGAVTIKTKHHFRHQPEYFFQMIARNGRTQRCHDMADAKLRQCHGVHVPFNDQQTIKLAQRLARFIQAV